MSDPLIDGGSVDCGSVDDQWATNSLDRLFSRMVLHGLALWQAVMVMAVWASSGAGTIGLSVAALPTLLAVIAIVAVRRRSSPWPVIILTVVVLVAVWSLAEDANTPAGLAAAWMANLSYLIPMMLLRGRRAILGAAVSSIGLAVGLWIVHPEWLGSVVVSVIVTGVTLQVVAWIGLARLRGFASNVQDESAANRRYRQMAEEVRVGHAAAAEQVRLLHDTAVNTLAAVASGGGATRNLELVRDRCRSDMETLELMLAEEKDTAEELDLTSMAERLGLEVRWQDLDPVDLHLELAKLPEQSRMAVARGVREALTNVSKHSGSTVVWVAFRDLDGVRALELTDEGRGFDPDAVRYRGLAQSLFGRCREAGVDVEVTSRAGVGTTVRFLHGAWLGRDVRRSQASPASVGVDPAAHVDPAGQVIALLDKAAWLWATGVVGVGLVIESANQPGRLTWTYGALVLVGGLSIAARSVIDRCGRLSMVAALSVAVGVPLAYLGALAGVGLGRGNVVGWQAIAVTPLLMILTGVNRPTRVRVGAVVLLLATAIAVAVQASGDGVRQVRSIILVGTLPPLGVLTAWLWLTQALTAIGERARDEQIAAVAAGVEEARSRSALSVRSRWRDAGVDRCLAMLGSIADGGTNPLDPAVRQECAREEAYLRQVMMLDPALVNIGPWLARALTRARDRGVDLAVHAGSADVGTTETAAVLGEILVASLDAVPASSRVVVSLLRLGGRLRFSLVGPSPWLAVVAEERVAPPGWTVSTSRFGDSEMVEVDEETMTSTPQPGVEVEIEDALVGSARSQWQS